MAFRLGKKRLHQAVLYDTEIYKNYFLAAFQCTVTGRIITFEKSPWHELDEEHLEHLFRRQLCVGFNNNEFDLVMISMAVAGFSTQEIKNAADDIIQNKMKPWQVAKEYNVELLRDLNHVDLIEVAPGQASLKIYNGRVHGKRMQDLPIEPDAILTRGQMETLKLYCVNDLDATGGLFRKLSEQLKLRETMSVEYGTDLRSKSDAQIAEAVISRQLEKLTGRKPEKPQFRQSQRLKYKIPDYIKFRTPQLRQILRQLETHQFGLNGAGSPILPKFLLDAHIGIGDSIYRMGIGGLHSYEQTAAHFADENTVLIDRDVASYYPRIILNQGLYPSHLGRNFLSVYRDIVDRRLAAKAAKDTVTADSLKITINGSFGKFGNRWSILYSPELLIQVTITGQLALLLLIEWIEAAGIPVVSANTDGVVIKCPKDRQEDLNEIVKRWEKTTDFETEETRYSAVLSRDVNNYIALYETPKVEKDGSITYAKTKGAYAPQGLQKNPANEICVDAVIDYMVHGTPPAQTIAACADVRKFLTIRTVRGGALKEGAYLGKAIRWYYGEGQTGTINYKIPNKSGTHNKVPRSDGAKPCMDLPEVFPDDINYAWYEAEAYDLLRDIGVMPKINLRADLLATIIAHTDVM